ncbi:MAG: glycine cleavage system aminomethyltransferase GcvT [Gammaproteobacteria bacterium]|nr:glycine cleavage system aminomethyltransferase GcvT [Gammaproteobacteria bacterium]
MTTSASPRPTPLRALHVERGARLTEFAGYELPVHYPAGILKEHQHTREAASLFDCSHMGQVAIRGPDMATVWSALEALVPADLASLAPGQQRYGFLTNETGGVRDDLMLVHAGDHALLVVNGAVKADDIAYLRAALDPRCALEEHPTHALLALQGPSAAAALAGLAPDVDFAAWTFMQGRALAISGIACYATRSGYTGEDGFEIMVPGEHAERLARALLAAPDVAPAGLGARDTLRLEAGLRLYGQDMDTTTTPIEAGLGWAIGAARRRRGARAGGFPGAAVILPQLDTGAARRMVGLVGSERTPVRHGTTIANGAGEVCGEATSGTLAPSLGQPVALAYVTAACAAPGTALVAKVRGRDVPMTVTKLPFVPTRYYRGA